jgi:hypothetical protein
MQVIHDCWNDQIPAAHFPVMLALSNHSERLMIANSLAVLCVRETQPTPFLLDYLTSLCITILEPCIRIFTDTSQVCSRRLVPRASCLAIQASRYLFNGSGAEFTAWCALNTLELCLNPPTDSSRAIARLWKSHAFSVFIASARLWFCELLQTRSQFSEAFPQWDLTPWIPFPQTLLKRAVLTVDLMIDLAPHIRLRAMTFYPPLSQIFQSDPSYPKLF